MGHEQFTWASLIPGLSSLPPHVSNGIIVSIILLIIVILGYKQLKRSANQVVPDDRLTFRNFVEIIVEGISGLERYLARGRETPEEKEARRFRSDRAATEAADAYIKAYPACIARQMKFKVEPRA